MSQSAAGSTTVLISNLDSNVTVVELKYYLEHFGKVLMIFQMKNTNSALVHFKESSSIDLLKAREEIIKDHIIKFQLTVMNDDEVWVCPEPWQDAPTENTWLEIMSPYPNSNNCNKAALSPIHSHQYSNQFTEV